MAIVERLAPLTEDFFQILFVIYCISVGRKYCYYQGCENASIYAYTKRKERLELIQIDSSSEISVPYWHYVDSDVKNSIFP